MLSFWKQFFSFILNIVFFFVLNQPVIHIRSLDISHCKPGFLHGLTVVISSWCVWVWASQFLHDGWGWTLLVLCSQFCCSVVENERQPPASTGTTYFLCHLHLQSISKLNGYWWSQFPAPPLHQSCLFVLSQRPVLSPGIALTWFCVFFLFFPPRVFLHDISHFYPAARRLSLFSVVTLHVFCCPPVVVMVCCESRLSCMVGQQQQQESVDCVSFCLFMVHGLEETKGWRRTNRGFVFIHTFNQGERAGHFYLRQCSLAVLLSCRCCCSNSRFNWSYDFRVCWTMFSEMKMAKRYPEKSSVI